MVPNSYDNIRASIVSSGEDSRVEVNQRALIDKVCFAFPQLVLILTLTFPDSSALCNGRSSLP